MLKSSAKGKADASDAKHEKEFLPLYYRHILLQAPKPLSGIGWPDEHRQEHMQKRSRESEQDQPATSARQRDHLGTTVVESTKQTLWSLGRQASPAVRSCPFFIISQERSLEAKISAKSLNSSEQAEENAGKSSPSRDCQLISRRREGRNKRV